MNIKLKKVSILLMILLIIILVVALIFVNDKRKEEKFRADNVKTELVVKNNPIKDYFDKSGDKVSTTYEYQKTFNELENSYDSIERALAKSVSDSKLLKKQIVSLTNINITSNGTVVRDTITIIKTDTFYSIVYFPLAYNDKWIRALAYKDSLMYKTFRDLSVKDATRRIPRKIQLTKWAGWEWTKKTDKGMIEIKSNNPNDSLKVRKVKILR